MNSNIKKNRLILAIITITLVGLIGVGMSYAYWRSTVIQDKTNVGASKCFSIELANQANEINLTNAYPITDAEGRKLTPYTFTLKNTCSMSAKYNLNMEMLSGTTLNSNYLAVLVNNNDIRLLSSYNAATTVIDGSTESRTLDTGTLAGNSSKDYSISLWIDEDVTLEDDILNKVFKSKVVIDAVATETAMEKIIASVDTTGKCPTINSDGTVNVTEKEDTNGYLCKAKDAYGDSYYYRGNVTNNYVKFADKYWRIVRINGDGTVRVIYDGTSAHANGESSSDRQIGTSAFNSISNDNAYVGYMYGATGASTYAAAHANTNDSTIKTYIDNWYKTNILGTANEQYLADNVFCNDRSLAGNNTGTGAGTSTSYYRWYNGPWDSEHNNKMLLTCPQQNDAFTVSDTTNGNGALTYPVGLLSADEIALAGGWNEENSGYYLYSGQVWWASSPFGFNGFGAFVRYVYSNGNANNNYLVDIDSGVRPVFNLKADILAQGSGTASDPYRISS